MDQRKTASSVHSSLGLHYWHSHLKFPKYARKITHRALNKPNGYFQS